jgi:hypothetical protein
MKKNGLFPFLQLNPEKMSQNYRVYDPNKLTSAYIAIKNENLPVLTAAKKYGVPETTLRKSNGIITFFSIIPIANISNF